MFSRIFMYHKTQSMGLGWKSVWCALRFNSIGTWRVFWFVRYSTLWFVTGIFAGSSSAFRSTGTWSSSWTWEGPEGREGREGEGGTTLRWTWKTAGLFCLLEDLHMNSQGKITSDWRIHLCKLHPCEIGGSSDLVSRVHPCVWYLSQTCAKAKSQLKHGSSA